TMMKPVLRLLPCGGAIVVPLLATAYLTCHERGWPSAGGLGVREVLQRLPEEWSRRDELQAQQAESLRRNALREEAVAALVAGRMTLLEAAARYRALAQETPGYHWEQFRLGYPGASDEERHCRQVIAAVQARLRDKPDETAEVVARLEAELEAP